MTQDKLIRTQIEADSARLCEAILAAHPPYDPPRRELSFDEQLALVAAGRAKAVPAIPYRRPDPEFTCGGVSWFV